jgi:predicted metalloprotease
MKTKRARAAAGVLGLVTAAVAGFTAIVATVPATPVAGEPIPGVVIVSAPPETTTVTVTVTPTEQQVPQPEQPQPQVPEPTDQPQSDRTTGASPDSNSGAGSDPVGASAAAAVDVINDYWTRTFQGWNGTWTAPQLWHGDGFYDSSSSATGPSCGEPAPAMNAFYCGSSSTGFVAWDRQLLEAGNSKFGDTFTYLVLAHEYGHAVQQRLSEGGADSAVSVKAELQADCMAGATLSDAVDHGTLELDSSKSEQLVESLQALGDNHPWQGEGDHGSSAQRVSSFKTGFSGGIDRCLAGSRT